MALKRLWRLRTQVLVVAHNTTRHSFKPTVFQTFRIHFPSKRSTTLCSSSVHIFCICDSLLTSPQLDYLTYATNTSTVTTASNGTDSTESAPVSTSTFTHDQSTSSPSAGAQSTSPPSTGAQPAVVGSVIGGIFGAFLIVVIGLWFIRRANQRRRDSINGSWNKNQHQRWPIGRQDLSRGDRRGISNRIDSGSSFGGPSDQSERGKKDGNGREEKRWSGIPVDPFSGPDFTSAPVPLATIRKLEAFSEAATSGGGRYLSATSTFISSSSGGEDGKEHIIHALTTNSPRQADPIPLDGTSPVYGSPQWSDTKRTNILGAARPFSSGSTLEVDGVLQRLVHDHSNIPGHSSREEESPTMFFSDHPFRSVGSGW
jgi:hypothetical protein